MLADEFSLFVEQRTNALHSGWHDDPTLFDYLIHTPPDEVERHGVAMSHNTLFATFRAAYGDHSWTDDERLQIRSGAVKFEIELRHFEDRFELQFEDGSVFLARPAVDTRRGPRQERCTDPQRTALDEGAALLQPITEKELLGAEAVIRVLLNASREHELTKVQRDRIITMTGLIVAERNETRPDFRTRWRLVGSITSALKYLATEPRTDTLAWQKLADILASIDWHNVAETLPR